MSRVKKEQLEVLEELTFNLMLTRVKEGTATASEIAQVLKYLGDKQYDMLGEPNEDAADGIMAGADADELDLPFAH